jgi:hypothetical protein
MFMIDGWSGWGIDEYVESTDEYIHTLSGMMMTYIVHINIYVLVRGEKLYMNWLHSTNM